MFSKIFALLLTYQDVQQLTGEIELLSACFFHTNPDQALQETLRTRTRRTTAEHLTAIFEAQSQLTKQEVLQKLKQELLSFEVIYLDIAISPTQENLEHIVTWLRKTIQPNLAVDIHITPEILGGTRITWRGKYGDYSTQKQINTYLKSKNIYAE